MQLQIYRSGAPVYAVNVGDDTVYKKELMGAHTITAEFYSQVILNVFIGDYIVFGGEQFYINVTPAIQKINATTFKYNVVFEGLVYKLYDKLLMDEGISDFNYYGAPADFLQLIIDNMNSIDTGWSIGFCDVLPEKNIQFTNLTCRQALTQLAETFKIEYSLTGKEISLKIKTGNVTTLSFQYGRGNGLYTLTRKPVQDANIVTRVYGFGAEKNLDVSYRDGLKRLSFEGAFLENNVDVYGVREGQYTNEDIYPHRTGTVSSVDANDKLSVIDASIDFNVNDYLLSGVTAQIIFQTGALAGYTFDINAFDNATKKISFNQFTDSNDYILPNDLNKAAVGDNYVIVNIKMPQSYIDAAESELQAATQEFLDQNSSPNVTYDLEIDEKFARINNISINVGDQITVIDADLNINNSIRCISISFPLVNPFLIQATIADSITYTVQEKQIARTVNNQQQLVVINRTQQENQRINSIIYKKMKNLIFDPDGYFQSGDISATTIETGMLSVGLPSQNFSIDGVSIEPNYGGDVNTFNISAGTLFHNVYDISGLGNVWAVNGANVSGLDPAKAYYVYARCSRTALTGDWLVDENKHNVDEEVGYWKFNLGILFPVISGSRMFRFTNGMAYIFGDNVVAGMVRSVDGTQYIDLNHSKFWFGVEGNSIDFDVTNPATLTIDGALVSKMIFAEDAEIVNLVIDTLVTTRPTDDIPNPKRVEIKKDTNSLKFFVDDAMDPVVTIDVISETVSDIISAGISVRQSSNVSEVTLSGIFSNASNRAFVPASSGLTTNASVVGLLQERTSSILPDGISAGVVGIDQTSDADGNSQSFGGFFNSAFVGGIFMSARTITADYTPLLTDTLIIANAGLNVLLPAYVAGQNTGKLLIIYNLSSSGDVIVTAAVANNITYGSSARTDYISATKGEAIILVWSDEGYWVMNTWNP